MENGLHTALAADNNSANLAFIALTSSIIRRKAFQKNPLRPTYANDYATGPLLLSMEIKSTGN